MVTVKVNKGEPVSRALLKLKKKMLREGTLKSLYNKKHFDKPSRTKYKKKQKAKYIAKMRAAEDALWR